MRMLRSCLRFLGLILSLAACGGPPESRVALSEPGAAAYDLRLAGNWYFANDRVALYLHILPREQIATLGAIGIGVGYQDGDPVRWIKSIAHASDGGGETFRNVNYVASVGADDTAEGERPSIIVPRHKFPDGRVMSLCFIDNRAFRDVIEKRQINGRMVKGSYGGKKATYLELSWSELSALMGEAMFGAKLSPCR